MAEGTVTGIETSTLEVLEIQMNPKLVKLYNRERSSYDNHVTSCMTPLDSVSELKPR